MAVLKSAGVKIECNKDCEKVFVDVECVKCSYSKVTILNTDSVANPVHEKQDDFAINFGA